MIRIQTIQNHIIFSEKDNYQFLLLKRKSNARVYPGMWQVVTGKIESGEKAFQAATREAIEETGLDIIDFWHVPHIGSFYDFQNDCVQNIPIFASLVNSKEVKLSYEHEDYKWLDFEEAIRNLALPSHIEGTKILKKYILDTGNKEFFRIYI